MENTVILTQRKKDKYSHGGYMYVTCVVNSTKTIQFWRCDQRHRGCNARLWTNVEDHTFHSIRSTHTCRTVGNAAEVSKHKFNTVLSTLAARTQENPAQIRARAIEGVGAAVHGVLPSRDASRRRIQRERRKQLAAPENPETLPEEMRRYEFENFILADSGEDDADRIFVFGRESHQQWSNTMRHIYMDGTFLLSPSLFSKIFVTMARKNESWVFPILYCLLPNKRGETYLRLFRMFRDMWSDFNPETTSIDYEIGIHQALNDIFPLAHIHGCLFHLMQNLRKHLAAENLLRRYSEDAQFALHAKIIVSVAFVPEQNIVEAVTALEEILPDEIEPILNWFITTYFGRLRNNGTRAAPLFPNAVWSVYQRTLNGQDRTNNYAEACHKRLQLGFGAGISHPPIWFFISKLRSIQKLIDIDYELCIAGHEGTRKRRRHQEADARILRKVQNYDDTNIIEYLRGISYNYNMY